MRGSHRLSPVETRVTRHATQIKERPMHFNTIREAPINRRGGQTSYLLLGKRTSARSGWQLPGSIARSAASSRCIAIQTPSRATGRRMRDRVASPNSRLRRWRIDYSRPLRGGAQVRLVDSWPDAQLGADPHHRKYEGCSGRASHEGHNRPPCAATVLAPEGRGVDRRRRRLRGAPALAGFVE